MLKYIDIRNIAIVILTIAVMGLMLTGCKAFTVQTRTLIDYRYTPGHSYQTIDDQKVVERYEPEKFELLWLYTYENGSQSRKWEECTRFEYQKAKEELGEVEP